MSDDVSKGLSSFVAAISAFSKGEIAEALSCFRDAREADPGNRLFAEAFRHAESLVSGASPRSELYDSAAAFRAFVRGGGNTRLYEALSAALSTAHLDHPRP